MHTQLIDISPLSPERHFAWPVPQETQLGIHCAVKKLSHQLLIDNDAHEYDDDTIWPADGEHNPNQGSEEVSHHIDTQLSTQKYFSN